MEFRWAAEGKTEKLRQWLREHPERVNVPAQGSNMTLLYTCISNANRTDLASLQAGHSCYLSTIQMLCEEYKADVLAPNGGSCNTALHLAASIGAAGVVRYLVEVLHTPVDSTNVFGERPLQIAQRNGHTKCASILTAAAAAAKSPSAQDQPLAGRGATPSQPASPCTPPLCASAGGLAGEYGGLFRGVTVSDRDDKGDDEGMMRMRSDARVVTAVRATNEWNHHRLLDGIGGGPPSLPTQVTPLCGNGSRRAVFSMDGSSGFAVAGTAHSSSPHLHSKGLSRGAARCTKTIPARFAALAESNSAACLPLPVPLQPRKEYDISSSHIFANPDLQGFRLVYGDGFKFVQCSDHYEIRGILPYTYRGTVYYTPVIISVYAPLSPTDSLDSTAGGGGYAARGNDAADAASDESVLSYPPSGTLRVVGASEAATLPILNKATTKVDVHCRYRVCLNLQSLNNFTISRKAEYLDPISGAIIPAPGDDKYQSLTAYIRNVVVRNFEAVPPLIVPTSSYAFPLLPNLSWLGSSGDADVYRHHHSHNAPAFMKNALPNRTAAHIRCATILRDLSRFGDGLARYDPEKHCIAAYVPIFSEHKVSVLAMPQERPYVTTAGQGSTTDVGKSTLREDSATFSGGKAEVTQQVAVEAVVELQVRVFIQFSPTCSSRSNATSAEAGVGSESDVYAYPPRIYLVDATTRPLGHLVDGSTPTNTAVPGSPSSSSTTPSASSTAAAAAAAGTTLTAQCFAGIIKNRETGEVWPELLHLSQESWSATGSLYNILVELQCALKGVLESFAMNYTGRRFSSSPPRGGRLHFSGSDSRPAGAPPSAPVMSSSLDKFFGPTPISTQSLTTGLGSEGSCSIRRSSAGYCLYCMQSLRSSSRALLLMPCGHNGLCGLCVQRLQSHCREEVFACPVCRGDVRYVMEVVPSEGGKKA
ncbi:uncharacterized protein JKF63_08010 [Porcisia hertigi]|uniref:RING-type domain-containing protein n=1 Tax=Porcisia hertigi TaxID=2761500 RepID=A0A836L4Q0_9TRYP|nr:hypothetical protein JKF63_08010 [Porcisia hertigi]